jgi:hypothetical protein
VESQRSRKTVAKLTPPRHPTCQIIVQLADAVAVVGAGEPAVLCCTNGISAERAALRLFERTCGGQPAQTKGDYA